MLLLKLDQVKSSFHIEKQLNLKFRLHFSTSHEKTKPSKYFVVYSLFSLFFSRNNTNIVIYSYCSQYSRKRLSRFHVRTEHVCSRFFHSFVRLLGSRFQQRITIAISIAMYVARFCTLVSRVLNPTKSRLTDT